MPADLSREDIPHFVNLHPKGGISLCPRPEGHLNRRRCHRSFVLLLAVGTVAGCGTGNRATGDPPSAPRAAVVIQLSMAGRVALAFLGRAGSCPHASAAHAVRRIIIRLPADTAFDVTPTERLTVGPQPVCNLAPDAPMARVVDHSLQHGEGSCLQRNLKFRNGNRFVGAMR